MDDTQNFDSDYKFFLYKWRKRYKNYLQLPLYFKKYFLARPDLDTDYGMLYICNVHGNPYVSLLKSWINIKCCIILQK